MKRTLRLLVAFAIALLATPLLAGGLGMASTISRPLLGGAIEAAPYGDDRDIERVLLPAGRYTRELSDGTTESLELCAPRLFLAVEDGDGWLLSDGVDYAHYDADPRIRPLARAERSISIRVAAYLDPGASDPVSIAAARASVREFLPLYASLFSGGALTVEVEEAGEIHPGDTGYTANGVSFNGPDLLEVRRAAGDARVGMLLTPERRHDPVRGLAYFDLLDARPGTYTSYTGWFRKAEVWRAATGRSLDETLSLDDLRGRELLEFLAQTPEEINDTAVVAWHELLHVIELRTKPEFLVHDWSEHGHDGVQDQWVDGARSIERSWYAISTFANLGTTLVERVEGCAAPDGEFELP